MRQKFIKSLKKDYNRHDVRQGLKKVYSTRDGHLPDLSRLAKKERHYLRNTMVLLFFILAFLAVAAWAGFAVFNKSGGQKGGAKLEITAPQEIASGAEITYLIKYKNLESTALKNIELSVHYPEGFIFISSSPQTQNESQTLWQLNSLDKGADGQVEIKGRLVGEIDTEKILTATLSYWPENFNSEFQTDQTFTSKITSSVISFEVTGPKQILADQDAEYRIKYKNESGGDLADMRLKITYPEDFVFDSVSPKPEKRNEEERHLGDLWLLNKLAKDETGEIKIKGKLIASGHQKLTLVIEAEMKGEGDRYFLQQKKEFITQVLGQSVSMKLVVNNANDNASANLGDTLNYSLICKNIGDQEISDLIVTAKLNPSSADLLDWTSLKDDKGGVVKDNKITWTKKEIPALAGLLGGAELTLEWQIKLNRNAANGNQLKIDNYAEMAVGKIAGEKAEFTVKSNLVTTKINSDVELHSAIRYFDNDNIAVGSGPLPPKVGQTTKYRVYWRIVNTLHELTKVKVTVVLPDYVSWTNKINFAKGDIAYNPATREIGWNLSRLPLDLKEVSGDFEIAFTPTSDHVEKIIILMPSTKLEAVDKETSGAISKSIGSLTTDLADDPQAQGKGLVAD